MKTSFNSSINKLFLLLVFGCYSSGLTGQAGEFTGLVFDSSRYAKFQLIKDNNVKNETLPRSKSLKAYAPFPKTQGLIPSCVGWAVGYGALSIYQAKRKGQTDRSRITNELAHSASYIYNQIKIDDRCNRGALLEDAIELLSSQGNCLAKTFPNDPKRCDKLPTSSAKREAAAYRVTNAGKIFELNASASYKIRQVKRQIFRDNPVIVGMSIMPKRPELYGKKRWDMKFADKGHHAMVVVGYDDNDRTFELMNSYGKRWGDGGFIKIGYEDFAQHVQQAFVLDRRYIIERGGSDDKKENYVAVNSSSKLNVEYRNSTNRAWSKVAVSFDHESRQYETLQEQWNAEEDQFRFKWEIPAGRCAYLLSIDSRGKPSINWSMDYINKDTLVNFPDRGAYQYDQAGEEHLLFLISHRPIEDLENNIKPLRFAGGKMETKLTKVLGKQLVPLTTTTFDDKEVRFSATSYDLDRSIIAAILRLELRE